jgi:hypothetical protein
MANRAKNVFSLRAVLQAGVGLRGPIDVDITFPKQCVLGKGTAAPGLTVEAMAGIHDQRLVRGDTESDGTTLAASQVRHQDFLIGVTVTMQLVEVALSAILPYHDFDLYDRYWPVGAI